MGFIAAFLKNGGFYGKNNSGNDRYQEKFFRDLCIVRDQFFPGNGRGSCASGRNGAGKSTLIKVLGGIYKPDSGTIKINGQEVEINGVSDAQEKGIGIIHQEIVLVPYLTVAQNLFLGREIKTKFGTVDMRETNRRAGEMLATSGSISTRIRW